mgnify:CR=1 FL=1
MYAELFISIGILLLLAFTNKRRGGFSLKEMVILAMLTALASASRVVLMAIPNAKPTSFIIISTGMIMGGGAGLVVGLLVPLISNFVLGMGPWLPWQMGLWGLMGLFAPVIRGKNRILQSCYGFIWGLVFGWVMNLWYYADGMMPFSLRAYALSCVGSFSFDITHAIVNALLLLVFSGKWLEHILNVSGIECDQKKAG